ncbi:MAG: efflux RND transporter periplasmic adaptor subunit [Lentisphaerae bacterium]|nr:efflux RND transporter periplasmic adaptor subunit [Lentisphaerota bacterium]
MRLRKGLLIWTIPAAIGAGIAVMAAVLILRKPEARPVQEEKAVPVRTRILAARRVADTVRLPGLLEPSTETGLSVEQAGRITALSADKGDRVEAGQTLLRLDSRTWEAMLRRAEVELREAEKDYVRYEELSRTGAVSQSDLDRVRQRRDLAQAARDEAAVYVERCTVRTPLEGVVDARPVEVGEFVREGQPVFTVVATDSMTLAVDVPERDIGAVRPGMALPCVISALNDRAVTGTVSFVAARAGSGNNAYRVEADLRNTDGALKGGMIADVTLVRRILDGAIVIPLAAVVPQRGEHVAFCVEEGRAVRRVVRIDEIMGHEAVIGAGLKAGDALVVEGQRGLADGMAVTE